MKYAGRKMKISTRFQYDYSNRIFEPFSFINTLNKEIVRYGLKNAGLIIEHRFTSKSPFYRHVTFYSQSVTTNFGIVLFLFIGVSVVDNYCAWLMGYNEFFMRLLILSSSFTSHTIIPYKWCIVHFPKTCRRYFHMCVNRLFARTGIVKIF